MPPKSPVAKPVNETLAGLSLSMRIPEPEEAAVEPTEQPGPEQPGPEPTCCVCKWWRARLGSPMAAAGSCIATVPFLHVQVAGQLEGYYRPEVGLAYRESGPASTYFCVHPSTASCDVCRLFEPIAG